MNAGWGRQLIKRLANRHHLLLAGHLLMLHALAFGGWQVPAVRLLWLVALGFFLLWQPFVDGEQRVSGRQAIALFGAALASTWLLGPWLLLIWSGALAASIGGRVMVSVQKGERAGYLLAFGYLVALTMLGIVPEISPAAQVDSALRDALAVFMPLALPLLLLFPARAPQRKSGEAFDLFYGMLVFLVLAVLVLGALAYIPIGGTGYIESLFRTSMTVAGALLVVAWAWNPRGGFSGVSSAISRYLLSLGMPLEQWLVHLSQESEKNHDPEVFLAAAMQRLAETPWILGVSWQTGTGKGGVGDTSLFTHDSHAGDLRLRVFFRNFPSPALQWHVDWLLRLAIEFYLVKRQSQQLQRMGYVQAIYETGARVTHDVKNLLQSLQALCYAASQPGDPADVANLLRRQLPLVADRLRSTLDKLQSPRLEDDERLDARAWWLRLQERYAHADIEWHGEPYAEEVLPRALFDSVAENLLQNAIAKRQRESGLFIDVTFGEEGLSVTDNGSAIPPGVAEGLLNAPVASNDGLGVGLYHAAKQAEAMGYRLSLVTNQKGCVLFRLAPPVRVSSPTP
ncbi:HAMP domain-containing sensor histidine kinase [Dechloromonas sp. CZR5]|uniref:sensor histidine kinase n=1 Tax=Dechloromonas sp. CZR5 TaxID=2608630 RepID=UPI00168AD22F|nr:HAMP domain-containing histidine kinase [Dechloromonas sp. CZR5]